MAEPQPDAEFNREQQKMLIRFALSQLRVENGAHQFERLCRNLALQRIASNIVPASGPVSGRGDQGRDFETYPSYLRSENSEGASFIALVGSEMAAFSCTLQQEDLKSKIKSDAKAITAGGRPVQRIYAFCERDIPVGDRHNWEKEVAEAVGVEIVIFDGNAVADMLEARDTLWIAAEFLFPPAERLENVESEVADSDWYTGARAKWRSVERPAGVFGEFWDLRTALRAASEAEEFAEDLPFWIGRAEIFLQVAEGGLERRIFYEIAVASLKGLGTLRGHEERLGQYLRESLNEVDAVALEDAQVLLMFAAGAAARGVADLSDEQLDSWAEPLREHIAAQIASAQTAGRRANLLQSLASLTLMPRQSDTEAEHHARIDHVGDEMWIRVIDEIEEAPPLPG